MRSRQRSLDGTKHKSTGSKIPCTKRAKKAGKTKKQIAQKKRVIVKNRSDAQATDATKHFTTRFKKIREEQKVFFGLDLHKKCLQVAVADQKGNLLMNSRVENDFGIIEQEFSVFPKNAKYALESSSAWYDTYRKFAGDMGLDMVLSNPCLTRLIAKSKKKLIGLMHVHWQICSRRLHSCILCLASKNRRGKAGGTLPYKNGTEQN